MKELHVYSAQWCSSCGQLKKILQETEIPVDRLRVHDVDASPDEVAKLSIRSIPTCILLVDGVEVKRKTGISTKQSLLEFIK